MFIKTFTVGPVATNGFVIADGSDAIIIDPGVGAYDEVIKAVDENSLSVKSIVLTHSHWDHTGDVAKLQDKYSVDVYIHPLDAENLQHPGSDGLPLMFSIDAVEEFKLINDGDIISCGSINFKVIHTPGHSPGSVVLYAKDENLLISGDTLFKGSIGNLSFPTSDPDAMWLSLKKLEELPKNTKVMPGHGDFTTIGEETWLASAKKIFQGE